MPHLGFNSLPTPSHIARWELLNLQFLPGVCAPLCVVLWRYTPRVGGLSKSAHPYILILEYIPADLAIFHY